MNNLHQRLIIPVTIPEIVYSLKTGAVIDRGWLVNWERPEQPMRKLSVATFQALKRLHLIKRGWDGFSMSDKWEWRKAVSRD